MSTEMEHLLILARDLDDANKALDQAEAALKAATHRRDAIAEVMLPEAMDSLGLKEFKLHDGSKITIKDDIIVGILKDNEPKAFAWMRDHEAGSLIKRQLKIDFGRGEDDRAQKVRDRLAKDLKRDIGDKTTVHWQTLRAWCKEMLEKGSAFPMDLFGVVPQRRAVVTPPAAQSK